MCLVKVTALADQNLHAVHMSGGTFFLRSAHMFLICLNETPGPLQIETNL